MCDKLPFFHAPLHFAAVFRAEQRLSPFHHQSTECTFTPVTPAATCHLCPNQSIPEHSMPPHRKNNINVSISIKRQIRMCQDSLSFMEQWSKTGTNLEQDQAPIWRPYYKSDIQYHVVGFLFVCFVFLSSSWVRETFMDINVKMLTTELFKLGGKKKE